MVDAQTARTDAAIEDERARDQADGRRLFLALLLWAAVAAISVAASRPPAPLPFESTADTASGARAVAILGRLAGGEGEIEASPRPVGTEANARCRDRIIKECWRVGLYPEVDERFAVYPEERAGGTVRNIVARRRGSGAFVEPGRAILCMAHYDSVGAGPGISDNLAGVATLIEVARALGASGGTRRDVIFLFEDAEEPGLLGAEAFAAQHPWAADVGAVVNLEARGTSGPSRMFETGAGNLWAIEAFADAARRPSASSVSVEVYRRMPNDTDYTVWRRRGVPGLNFAFIGDAHRYHTPLDDLDHVSPDSVQHHVTNAIDAIRALDAAEFPVERGEPVAALGRDAVFFDVAGRKLFSVRVRTMRILAALTLVLALFGVGRAVAGRAVRSPQLLVGFVLVPSALALAAVAAQLDRQAMVALGAPDAAFPAHPLPGIASLLGATIAGLVLVSGGLRLVLRAAECGAIVLLAFAVLGLVVAWEVPGAAHLLVVPALVLGVAASAMRTTGDVDARWGRAAVFSLGTAALLWSALHAGVVQAFGVAAPLAVAVPTIVVGAHALPLLVRGWRSLSPWLAAAAVALALLAGALASTLEPHTSDRPARLNLVHVQSSDEDARWQPMRLDSTLPSDLVADLRAAAGLPMRGVETCSVAWSGYPIFAASARSIEAEPPAVEIAGAQPFGDEGTLVRIRVRSLRGADQLVVTAMGAASMSVGGTSVPPGSFRFLGPGVEPMEFEVVVPEGATVELTAFDTRFGLDGVLAERARSIVDARTTAFVPSHDGDGSVLVTRGLRLTVDEEGRASLGVADEGVEDE
ncbi:MAG: M20/M25/M40 family metallo-hydrolase [Planctomycetota bacterium]